MTRTLFASALAALALAAALAPNAAFAGDGQGSTKEERDAIALWPSQRPYHVELGETCNKAPMLVKNYGPGPDFVWVGGYWDGSPGHYVWVKGRWDRPPHGHTAWVGPRWEKDHDGHFHQVRGEWR